MGKNKFKIGDIVTLKSHPLLFQENGEIDAYINQIPPFMCVKEVQVERKKHIYSADDHEVVVSDNVKYLCVYFNQHRTVFEERWVYQSSLAFIKEAKFHREGEVPKTDHIKLIDETMQYKIPEYEFGKRVFFKTYKLEKRKKYKKKGSNKKTSKAAYTHTSPALIIHGYKLNDQKSSFSMKTGELQRQVPEIFYKVMWYNAYQEKFSLEYLPREFLTDDPRIYRNKSVAEAQPKEKLDKNQLN